MRFAAVIRIAQQQSVRAPAPDFVRRIMSGELRLTAAAPATVNPSTETPEPVDLDQRVRLVGEW
jgi:hypothetical protein